MAPVTVAGLLGIVQKVLTLPFGGNVRQESYLFLVEDVVASVEEGRSVLLRLEQVPQRGDRSIVKVGGTGPDSIQRMVGVAVGLLEMPEAVLATGIEVVLVGRKLELMSRGV